jgi:hypothetical protein
MTGGAGPTPFPPPDADAFGNFQFGVSRFGTVPWFDYQQTIISQFANSPVLTTLLSFIFQWIDPTEFFDGFYGDIWNVLTAQGYGLDVWGRIVGVNRNLDIGSGTYFGFNEGNADGDYDNFGPGGQSPFYAGENITTTFALTDETYRQLILAKAAYNICDGSIGAVNEIMMTLFGASGVCYMADLGNMEIAYTFDFQPDPVQLAIIYQSGVLPKPVGVVASVVIN